MLICIQYSYHCTLSLEPTMWRIFRKNTLYLRQFTGILSPSLISLLDDSPSCLLCCPVGGCDDWLREGETDSVLEREREPESTIVSKTAAAQLSLTYCPVNCQLLENTALYWLVKLEAATLKGLHNTHYWYLPHYTGISISIYHSLMLILPDQTSDQSSVT